MRIAKRRMKAGVATNPLPTLAEGGVDAKGDTRDKLADAAGVSHGTLDKVARIAEKATPDPNQKIDEGGAA